MVVLALIEATCLTGFPRDPPYPAPFTSETGLFTLTVIGGTGDTHK